MTLKQLIDRQLGELPDEIKDIGDALELERITGILFTREQENWYLSSAQEYFKTEQSRRELLERLIEKTYQYIEEMTYFNENDTSREHAIRDSEEDIKLIEKILSERTPITWDEIVKALEE